MIHDAEFIAQGPESAPQVAKVPVTDVDPSFVPRTDAELMACLGSWRWRMFSGLLYEIMIKGDEDAGIPTTVLPFIPNVAQTELFLGLHNRNVVLKARQLGITTAMCILLGDHALFRENQRCGIIAHTLTDAENIFQDKVKFAYDRLPEALRLMFPVTTDAVDELAFSHNSSIRVATSMRGGTLHRLHISEMGKIAKESRKKAREIVTGSLQAVPSTGIATIESTAEGREGEFYEIATRAQAKAEAKVHLSPADYKFFFFPWFQEPKYRVDPTHVRISEADHVYFAKVEAEMGVRLDMWQRAFYVSKRDNDFSGDSEKMWQEWPSTPEECWQQSTEGTFYARQLAMARRDGRITVVPHIARIPVNTFWDIGRRDGTAIWLHQYVGMQHRFIGFIEDWDQPYDHYIKKLRETGYLFGAMFLPHDALLKRQQATKAIATSPLEMLQDLAPDWSWHVVPRVQTLQHGIEITRLMFNQFWFDAKACAAGLEHLSLYKKKWNTQLAVWSDVPDHDNPHTEAADALRQCAQGFDADLVNRASWTRPRNRMPAHLV